MARLVSLICAVFLICATARAGDWSVVRFGGRDYLTLRNVAEFYELSGFRRVSNTLMLGTPTRSLRGTIGSNEFYINNLKFILSYPIEMVNGEPVISRMDLTKVIEPVMRPSRIRDAAFIDSVVLDPGHGGYDNGATSLWGYEKNYSLDVAWRAKALLEMQGLRVSMTRTRDVFVPLEDRVRFANQHPHALFIAIHFNSGGSDANGVETYTLAPRGVPSMAADGPMLSDLRPCAGNICDAENMALACATHASLISHSRLYDRGIKRARFVVIRDITIPGVLIEGGFLSNPTDARLIAAPQYRQEEAQCIAIAVRNYRNAVNAIPAEEGRDVVMRDDVPPPPEAAEDSAKPEVVGEQPQPASPQPVPFRNQPVVSGTAASVASLASTAAAARQPQPQAAATPLAPPDASNPETETQPPAQIPGGPPAYRCYRAPILD